MGRINVHTPTGVSIQTHVVLVDHQSVDCLHCRQQGSPFQGLNPQSSSGARSAKSTGICCKEIVSGSSKPCIQQHGGVTYIRQSRKRTLKNPVPDPHSRLRAAPENLSQLCKSAHPAGAQGVPLEESSSLHSLGTIVTTDLAKPEPHGGLDAIPLMRRSNASHPTKHHPDTPPHR